MIKLVSFAQKKTQIENEKFQISTAKPRQMFLLYPLFLLLSYHSLVDAQPQPYYVFLPHETGLKTTVSSSTATTSTSYSSSSSLVKTHAIHYGHLKKAETSSHSESDQTDSDSNSDSETQTTSSDTDSTPTDSDSTESPSITSNVYPNSDAYKWAFFGAMASEFDYIYSSLVSNYTSSLSAGEYNVITSIQSVMNNGSRYWSVYECGALCTDTLDSLYSNVYSEFPDDLQSSVDSYVQMNYAELDSTSSDSNSDSDSDTDTSTSSDFLSDYRSDYLQQDIYKTYYTASLYQECSPISTAQQGVLKSICDNVQTLTSDLPFLDAISEDARYGFIDMISRAAYTWGNLTLNPYATTPQTINDTGVYVSTYYPLEVTYNITQEIYITSWDTIFSETIVSPSVSSTVMTSSNKVSKGAVTSNILTTTGHLEVDIQKLVNCGVQALIFDYANKTERFTSYIDTHGNETFVLQYVDIVNGSLVDVNIAKYPKEFQRVNANFYNFIYKLPLERQDSLLDYMGYCFLQKFTNLPITHDDSTTAATPFEMKNWKSGDGSFFKEMFSFGYNSGFVIYFSTTLTTTDTNGFNTTTVVMSTTSSYDMYGSSLLLPTSICEQCDSASWGVTQVRLTTGASATDGAHGEYEPMAVNGS
ncbi:unnamed protein product [Ambrosiozyma monospora]|uniref:Unnamed protein product n=1 Tax=Ambrosiozyma monospora TaxID=43982 RepID=A0ACB5SRI7_AMBMO|nr:unnamed protein product [Ambrosiozyma monospora]